MKHHKPLQLKRALPAVVSVALLSLAQFVPASGPVTEAPLAQGANVCIDQATAQIGKVRYLGKNSNGKDEVEVDWLANALSDCFLFGSGQAVPGKINIPPYGYEITVKIKRRLGHEDSATVTKREFVKGNVKTIVRIPRANLETDPVSFVATLKTTVGAVLTKRIGVGGNGAPSLAGATQTVHTHSTITGTPSGCYPLLDVRSINFIPGSGATPDNVAINWGSGGPPTACFDPPRFSVYVDVTRPGGRVDKVQTVFGPGSSTATLQLPGAPGAVLSFHVVVEAISGAVVDKTSTQSGNF